MAVRLLHHTLLPFRVTVNASKRSFSSDEISDRHSELMKSYLQSEVGADSAQHTDPIFRLEACRFPIPVRGMSARERRTLLPKPSTGRCLKDRSAQRRLRLGLQMIVVKVDGLNIDFKTGFGDRPPMKPLVHLIGDF